MSTHALDAGVAFRSVFPSDHVEAFWFSRVARIKHSHHFCPVSKSLKVTVKVRSGPLKGRVPSTHPSVDVASTDGSIVANAQNVGHSFQPGFSTDNRRTVADVHGDGLLHAVGLHHGQSRAVGVGRGQKFAGHGAVFVHNDLTGANQLIVNEDERVNGHAQPSVFTSEHEIVPLASGHGGECGVSSVQEEQFLNIDGFRFSFTEATGQRGKHHQDHEHHGLEGGVQTCHDQPSSPVLIGLRVVFSINTGHLSIQWCSQSS